MLNYSTSPNCKYQIPHQIYFLRPEVLLVKSGFSYQQQAVSVVEVPQMVNWHPFLPPLLLQFLTAKAAVIKSKKIRGVKCTRFLGQKPKFWFYSDRFWFVLILYDNNEVVLWTFYVKSIPKRATHFAVHQWYYGKVNWINLVEVRDFRLIHCTLSNEKLNEISGSIRLGIFFVGGHSCSYVVKPLNSYLLWYFLTNTTCHRHRPSPLIHVVLGGKCPNNW